MEIKKCKICKENPILVKKSGACSRCYQRLRRAGEIPPVILRNKPKFTRDNLVKKYGLEFLADMDKLWTHRYWSLTEMGNKYNVTREWIRQLVKRLYGISYTEGLKQKSLEQETACLYDPRRKAADYKKESQIGRAVAIELSFFNECKKRSLNVKPCKNPTVDITVNDYLVDVKSANVETYTAKGQVTPYYHYGTSTKQRQQAHFFACYHPEERAFFIIPTQEIKSNGFYIHVVLSNYRNSKNSYWQYKNAWNLLENQKGESHDRNS